MPAFPNVEPEVDFPALDHAMLSLWARTDAFARSVSQRPETSAYVFYDGPPFATGLPHYGHLVASTLKDIVPRYWAMRGHRVERRFGWDTHGLPIEMEMEKASSASRAHAIREYGVDKFNEACRENVLRYTAEWERVIGRLGRWVDFRDDYKTMDRSFMESVWWVFSRLWQQGPRLRRLPRDALLVAAVDLALELRGQLGLSRRAGPRLTVTMPFKDAPKTALLVWTTTPWTLPSNLGVAVGESVEYIYARRAPTMT
jgi:isoleucyl-tRNA synthetase